MKAMVYKMIENVACTIACIGFIGSIMVIITSVILIALIAMGWISV